MKFIKNLVIQLIFVDIYNGDIWCSFFKKNTKNLKNIYWSLTSET